jgi:hypothetical protein
MHVTLDCDHWEVATQSTLGEVLADLSEKAHAHSRLITSLTVDHRTITDRDLDPAFLGEPVAKYSQLEALSRTVQEIRHGAEESIRRYGIVLRDEACALAARFRLGEESVSALDAWLGQLADYLEILDAAPAPSAAAQALSPWVQELLQARTGSDLVRLADLLEYELAPQLER